MDESASTKNSGSISVPVRLRAAVEAALASEGEPRVMRRLALSRSALLRIAAGRPVRRATVVVAAQGLGLELTRAELGTPDAAVAS